MGTAVSMNVKKENLMGGKILGDFQSRTVWIVGPTGLPVRQLLPDRSIKLRNHSPDGFNWGYLGSGPSQLALALLLYYLNDEKIALQWYQSFKNEIVASLPQADFTMEESVILDWIKKVIGE